MIPHIHDVWCSKSFKIRSVKELFSTVAQKVADRPGGYTRVIRAGFRPGDNAELAFIELVDFNEVYTGKAEKKSKTRRGRRRGKKSSDAQKTVDKAVNKPVKNDEQE